MNNSLNDKNVSETAVSPMPEKWCMTLDLARKYKDRIPGMCEWFKTLILPSDNDWLFVWNNPKEFGSQFTWFRKQYFGNVIEQGYVLLTASNIERIWPASQPTPVNDGNGIPPELMNKFKEAAQDELRAGHKYFEIAYEIMTNNEIQSIIAAKGNVGMLLGNGAWEVFHFRGLCFTEEWGILTPEEFIERLMTAFPKPSQKAYKYKGGDGYHLEIGNKTYSIYFDKGKISLNYFTEPSDEEYWEDEYDSIPISEFHHKLKEIGLQLEPQ